VIGALRNYNTIQSHHTRRPIDILFIFIVRKFKADIHHITGAINYLAFGLPRDRTIITVHDIGHYTETMRGWRKAVYKQLFWRFPLTRVRHITTISDFSKEQLIKHFGIEADRITVIPNPVGSIFKFVPRPSNKVPVILQIGDSPNKNAEVLIGAVKGLNIKLLLLRPPANDLIKRLLADEIQYEFRDNLSDAELVQAYADSDIVYFASTYEGFGLPILEGMAVGRPVITSNISPMKDVAMDNAWQVDPASIVNVRDAIRSLLSDSDLYATYQKRGLRHVESFHADKIASQYHELYQRLIMG
jgi:glycosyltransferase involved in cell wall biosynthesis